MRIEGAEPVKINGKWELKRYVRYEDFPESEGRHRELCVVCGWKTCPNERGTKNDIYERGNK